MINKISKSIIIFSVLLNSCVFSKTTKYGQNVGEEHDGRYPYIAYIENKIGNSICTGLIIHPEIILIGRHCTQERAMNQYIGVENIIVKAGTYVASSVKAVKAAGFSYTQSYGYALAVLFLIEPLPINDFIRPLKLPNALTEWTNGKLLGWKYDGDYWADAHLRYTDVTSDHKCLRHNSEKTLCLHKEVAGSLEHKLAHDGGVLIQEGASWLEDKLLAVCGRDFDNASLACFHIPNLRSVWLEPCLKCMGYSIDGNGTVVEDEF